MRKTSILFFKVAPVAETVCLLSNRKPDTTVKLSVDMDEEITAKYVAEQRTVSLY